MSSPVLEERSAPEATTSPGSGPRVTVAIPSFNGARYLGAAIHSVLLQSFTDFELLVVDDGSTDETAQVVESFADPRVRFFRSDRNIGPQENWNRCIQLARGHYLKVLPHDDIICEDCLRQQVSVLDADREHQIAMAFCARTVIDPEGRVIAQRRYPGGREGRVAAADIIRLCVRYGTNVIGEPGGVLFRRATALEIGGFDATYPYLIDLDYWVRLLRHGDAWYCREPLARFRVSPGQWSVRLGSRQSADFRRFIGGLGHESNGQTKPWDRLCGRFMPTLNNLARLAFYRIHFRP